MRVERLRLRDFRGYAAAEVALGEAVTVIHGRNGSGKTNLLEALYFACTGRSCRTASDREVVRFGATIARVELDTVGEDGPHEIAIGLEPGVGKRATVDGVVVERLLDSPHRPLAAVFLPDRLELVTGAPAVRRAHLDQLVAALWPARRANRRAYAQALAQRNALLGRVRAGRASRDQLPAWDLELARQGLALMEDRAAAVAEVAERFARLAGELGLDGEPAISYRPASSAATPGELAAELAERTDSDLDRGFTGTGPHRDDIRFTRETRPLRAYGSQGQQRLAVLALLLAEREALALARGHAPLTLLDDVMSELDAERRRRLADLLADPERAPGQSVITTTDASYVPGSERACRVAVCDGAVLQEAAAA